MCKCVEEKNKSLNMFKICSIVKDENEGIFYYNRKEFKTKLKLLDYKGDNITSTKAMNTRYREERKRQTDEYDLPVVWVLKGKRGEEEEKCLQVGRNKNLKDLLSNDIRRDIIEIICEPGSKYNNLITRCNYDILTFYEVNLESNEFCLDEYCFSEKMLGNEYLKKIYLTIKASFAEGKIAADNVGCYKKDEQGDGIWNPSPTGIDGYFYNLIKEENEHKNDSL